MLTGNITDFVKIFNGELVEIISWLKSVDADIATGTYLLCNGHCKAIVSETETTPGDTKQFEAHKRFIDLHYDISGSEIIEYTTLSALTIISEYDEKNDYFLCASDVYANKVMLEAGKLCMLFPQDAHKPCCSQTAETIKKVVIKIPVEMMDDNVQILNS